ncbi:MAG: hypothetical protein PG978_000595 [Wolbachia endosymbiont of Ctenocephalides felis wCfeF]|nr:MAG: hypothetical protein PG978_000595 [Wolbachia endosymbiont of Ctenocephalides felis wCfeF]
MTDFINLFDDYSGFFEDNAYYVVSEYNKDSPDLTDLSTYIVERDEHKNLVFKNLYEYICPDGNIHKDIVLDLRSLQIEERVENSSGCHVNNYKVDNGTLSSDGKELIFNIIPTEEGHSREFNIISITKI